jgi:hypothetical protein
MCQFSASNQVFPIGSVVPQAAIDSCRNKDELLRSYIRWEPPHYTPAVFPRDIVVSAAPVQAKPAVKIVPHKDPVTSWKLSVAETAKETGVDVAVAADRLRGTHDGAALYKLAQRVATAEERAKHGGQQVSITPEMVGL